MTEVDEAYLERLRANDPEHVKELIRLLYRQPECEAGGPLHIVTDDQNVELFWLAQVARKMSDEWRPSTVALAAEILVRLAALDEDTRYDVCMTWDD